MTRGQILRLSPLLLMLFITTLMASGLLTPSVLGGRMAGKTIGQFQVPLLDGTAYFTNADLKGPAVINVFASWCTPCRVEHRVLLNMAQRGIPVYGVAWKDNTVRITKWLTEKGNPYQLIGIDETGTSTVPLGLTGVPETFVVDGKGKVRYHRSSALRMEDVTRVILPLMNELKQEAANGN